MLGGMHWERQSRRKIGKEVRRGRSREDAKAISCERGICAIARSEVARYDKHFLIARSEASGL